MTEFNCPRHGPYARAEGLPVRLPTTCSECSQISRAALVEPQALTDAEIATWKRSRQSAIPERYTNRTVRNWVPQPGQEAASRMVLGWLDDLDAYFVAGEGLLFMGAPGVGKTHLVCGLVTAIIQAGYEARYAAWPDVWQRCRPPFDENPDSLLRDLAQIPVLALDEVGLRPGTPAEQARLFELVDERYREQLPTLIATNLTEATLPTIGERTADRLLEACLPVVVPGSSYRPRAALDRALKESPPAISRPVPRTVTTTVNVNGVDEIRQQTTCWKR